MRHGRVLAVGIGLAVIGSLSLAFRPRTVVVAAAPAVRGPFVVAVTAEGRSRIRDVYVVTSPVDGDLARLQVDAGDSVSRGDVVARIAAAAPRPLDARSRATALATVMSARAAVSVARARQGEAEGAAVHADSELATARRLAPAGTVPRKTLEHADHQAAIRHRAVDEARAAADVARAELLRAEAQLATEGDASGAPAAVVRAPVAGRVLRVLRESGGPVAAGTPLLELGNVATLEFSADLLTADAMSVHRGASATIREWGGTRPLRARVRSIEPAAFTKVSALGLEEQRVRVVLAPAEPLPPGLGHDFRISAAIEVWRGEHVLAVPSTALFRVGDRWAVFAVDRGLARTRLVTPGRTDGDRTAIESGLRDGETVLVQPSDAVQDGTRVDTSPGRR